MTSGRLAAAVIATIRSSGAHEAAICGGSRNAPLIAAAATDPDFEIHPFFEERSAAFFALGRARLTGRPVAVITTSGTAAAELLPAAIEAHYSGIPLLLVTADRPRRHAATGSPQAIEQAGLFGVYAEASMDLDAESTLPTFESWSRTAPYHVNVRFDEPLMEDAGSSVAAPPIPQRPVELASPDRVSAEIERHLAASERPLLLIGPLDSDETGIVASVARTLGIAVWAEALSGLRGDPAIADLQLTSGERILSEGRFDAVLRIGGVPTSRFWRDLDERLTGVPVLSIGRLPFSGLARGRHLRFDFTSGLDVSPTVPAPPRLYQRDREMRQRIDDLLDRHPASEPGRIREISSVIPDGSFVYLGNSLPVREFDAFAERRAWRMAGNRGANGIDGQISTFLGMAPPDAEAWCIVGDLTALYDLSSLWAAPFCRAETFRIVIVNNGGGRIFSRVPSLGGLDPALRRRLLENEHSVDVAPWPAMWGLPFEPWRGVTPDQDRVVIETRPDREQTEAFWREHDRIWTDS